MYISGMEYYLPEPHGVIFTHLLNNMIWHTNIYTYMHITFTIQYTSHAALMQWLDNILNVVQHKVEKGHKGKT